MFESQPPASLNSAKNKSLLNSLRIVSCLLMEGESYANSARHILAWIGRIFSADPVFSSHSRFAGSEAATEAHSISQSSTELCCPPDTPNLPHLCSG